jgi:hypothetical protein
MKMAMKISWPFNGTLCYGILKVVSLSNPSIRVLAMPPYFQVDEQTKG